MTKTKTIVRSCTLRLNLARSYGCTDGRKRLIVNDHGCYIEVVQHGNDTYLWIGCDTLGHLFALSGERELRRMARWILDEVGE